MSAEAAVVATGNRVITSAEERRVIIASSVGTVFEWYDFYLYAILAPFFAGLFFPPGNQTAALLAAFATYAAGFLVRPFGAIIFGRIGDLVGRKYTFLVTIVVMGLSTVFVGLLPTFSSIGYAAPFILVCLRLAQGLALGGEYGGAATYVAEHAPDHKRGYSTAWIQTTATVGMLMALIIIQRTFADGEQAYLILVQQRFSGSVEIQVVHGRDVQQAFKIALREHSGFIGPQDGLQVSIEFAKSACEPGVKFRQRLQEVFPALFQEIVNLGLERFIF